MAIDTTDQPGLRVVDDTGKTIDLYIPQDYQRAWHASNAPNLLALGTRGTGKSLMLRMDAHMRCLMLPSFHAIIVRRTMPELRASHLKYIEREAKLLGAVYLHTTFTVKYSNGSTLTFRHCETEADILNFLSSEYGYIGFDELSTFSLNQFLQISAAARAPEDAGYTAVIRAGSNPLGTGAEWMEKWFCTHDVRLEDYPDYNPDDFEMQFSSLDQNQHLDRKAYAARLRNLPEHVRRAWLLGEFVNEGAYFSDFHKTTEQGQPWHVIANIPTVAGESITNLGWINIYRAIDWGYFPDPAVCLWVAVLPNKRAFVFKERKWIKTLAADVAKDIKRNSEGMRIVESFCDPTMLIKEGQDYSIGEIFETNGVPVTAAKNDRILYGYSIHEYLNELVDGVPKVQMLQHACPDLIRTIPMMRMDKTDPRKLGDGDDHWVVALAYFCMGSVAPSRDPVATPVRRWMQPKSQNQKLRFH